MCVKYVNSVNTLNSSMKLEVRVVSRGPMVLLGEASVPELGLGKLLFLQSFLCGELKWGSLFSYFCSKSIRYKENGVWMNKENMSKEILLIDNTIKRCLILFEKTTQ